MRMGRDVRVSHVSYAGRIHSGIFEYLSAIQFRKLWGICPKTVLPLDRGSGHMSNQKEFTIGLANLVVETPP
jgi:hypothetical protein